MVARLVEVEVLDDEHFAVRFAEDKRALRDWGPDRIAEALRARGVAEDVIAAAVGAEGPEELTDRALVLLGKHGATVEDEASRARALSLLTRRGYPLELAYDAVRALERRSRAA